MTIWENKEIIVKTNTLVSGKVLKAIKKIIEEEQGKITFNTNLMYAPPECIEYVVLHEFCHFLQANHSKLFYAELAKVCPDWKEMRKMLKNINIR